MTVTLSLQRTRIRSFCSSDHRTLIQSMTQKLGFKLEHLSNFEFHFHNHIILTFKYLVSMALGVPQFTFGMSQCNLDNYRLK